MKADRPDIQQAALGYCRRGWSVVPVAAREKRPGIRWALYQQRCATEAEIRGWFARWPDANIGIVTGAVSGLVVLDVDPQKGGEEALYDWEDRYGPLPETIEAITGGSGRHLYFLHPGIELHNRVGLADGIDFRGDGGLVVAPPSVHPTGRRYVWEVSHHPDDMPLAPIPAWLLQRVAGDGVSRGHSLSHWQNLAGHGVAEGKRNSTIASFAGHLLWHGVDARVALDLLLCWNEVRCRPPLSGEEVARTVDSIARLHARGKPPKGRAERH